MAVGMRLLRISSNNTRLLSFCSIKYGSVIPFKLADIGEGIKEVTVKEWYVKPGDKVSQFDNICEVQSDKASVTITSRYDGHIKMLHYQVDDVALVGKALVDIELLDDNLELGTPDKPEPELVTSSEKQLPVIPEITPSKNLVQKKHIVLTTPAVRRIAMENNINLNDVPATGKDGRVLKEDVLAFLDKKTVNLVDRDNYKVAGEVGKMISDQEDEIIALQGYHKHMWTTMTQSLSIPHFVYSDEFDVTNLVEFRNSAKEYFKSDGISLSFLPFFIKATSKALTKYPKLNALLNEDTQTLRVVKSHNISIAIDTPQGLVVPNIKNVQNLGITKIAMELNRIQILGAKSTFAPADLSGGTFTLSNIGAIGGTCTKPVILPPQIMIGALGKIQKLPRFNSDGNLKASNILTVSWAADHRVVDGATVARFSNVWKQYVENPTHLLF